ncbi:MAG: hypothetical protein ABSF43_07400 [Rectinemataceae bacterium]
MGMVGRGEVWWVNLDPRILLDQIRCVDKSRLIGKIGSIEAAQWHDTLLEMFE